MIPTPNDGQPLTRNRNFLLYMAVRFFHVIGAHALTVAVGWHVYQLTRNPLDLGLVGLAQFAPAFVLFLAAGVAADRFDRRKIVLVCNLLHAIAAGLLFSVLSMGEVGVGVILAILALHGAAKSFNQTAMQAILPNLVTKAVFPKAVASASSVNKIAQLIGPPIGGLLIAWAGDVVYIMIVAMFGVAALAAAFIAASLKVRSDKPLSLDTVMEGFSYVWNNKIVLGAVSIDLMAVLLGGVMGLLPVFASDILHVGPDGLGLLRSMPAAGSLVTALILTRIAQPRHMGPVLFIALAVFGFSIVVFSLSEVFWVSVVALGVYGAADMVSVYVRQTLVQIATPDNMRGRVSAINSISINASNELGDFRAGTMAGVVGTVPAVLVGGVATLAVTALWLRMFPAIRRVDRLDNLT
jgi:predicted MFS family arabinose efflux permease